MSGEVYLLDSSVAVHLLIAELTENTAWFDRVTKDPETTVFASRLLQTELTRVLRREGIELNRRDAILDHIGLIPISDAILAAAESIQPHIKTFDAIHLATLIHTGIDAIVVTHDANMKTVAEAIGYATFDPVTATA